MSMLLVGFVLFFLGAVVGAVLALWFAIKSDSKSGDQPLPPYDDEGEWN